MPVSLIAPQSVCRRQWFGSFSGLSLWWRSPPPGGALHFHLVR